MIKKVSKNLRYTNYGKKIYENLMNNYGEYLSNLNNHKNSSKFQKKNLKKGINVSMNNTSYNNNNNNNNIINNEVRNDNFNSGKLENVSNKIVLNSINQIYVKDKNLKSESNKDDFERNLPKKINEIDNKTGKPDTTNKQTSDVEKIEKFNYINRMSTNNEKNYIFNNYEKQNSFSDLDKSFSKGRQINESFI